jgi:hypothetical protein
MELIIIGGDIAYEDGQTIEEMFQAPGNATIARNPRKLRAKVSMYLVPHDKVREIEFTGIQGVSREWEPSLEDRQAVDAFRMATLMISQGFDMHDFKKMLELAMTQQLARPVRMHDEVEQDFEAALVAMHHELGGLE